MAKPVGFERLAPWRFLLFFAALLIGWTIGASFLERTRTVLVGFDVAACAFLVSCVPALRHAPARMRSLAERSDANRRVMLILSLVVMIVVFAATVSELGLRGRLTMPEKILIVASVALAWTFGNAVYGFHYAHLFYSRDSEGKDRGGLEFPGTPEPLLSDFAYFAFTLGVAVQTSDVQVTRRHMRTVVLSHSIVGFFFNVGVLALAISVLGAS